MQFRNWDLDKDYPYLVKWWKQHEFGQVPKKCLPPEGIIVEENNIPICAGGLYRCVNSNFGVMEWIVVDENARLRVAHQALNLCIENILKLAKTYKIELVYTMTAEKALHKRYTKYHGMILVENDVKTFLKNLTETNYKNLDWISDEIQIKKQKEEIK
jgi:N-acetylglutamate synthase-like GNAT family acetyltransferase|tara:strand:- start:208 stop:681 length:474 start_codon:yes stop_codon:yes gene_type:complete